MFKRIVIDGEATRYFINKQGKVKNEKGKVMGYDLSNSGYYRVTLTINKKKRKFSVHRLVAMIFIRPILDGEVVNHINGKKLDNHVSNLEIVTVKQNSEHASENDLIVFGEDHYRSKYSTETVKKIAKMLEDGFTAKEISSELEVPTKLVYNILEGARKHELKDFNLPEIEHRRRFSKLDNEMMLFIIRHGYKNKDIIYLLGMDDSLSIRQKLKRLRHKCSTTI